MSVASTVCARKKCPTNQKCVVTLVATEESAAYNVRSGYMGFRREEKCYCDDGTQGKSNHRLLIIMLVFKQCLIYM